MRAHHDREKVRGSVHSASRPRRRRELMRGRPWRRRDRLASLPDSLVLHVRRFVYEDWVPRKLDTDVDVPTSLDLAPYYDASRQAPDEALLPDNDASAGEPVASVAAARPAIDEAIMAQLLSMGFPRQRCERALVATGGGNNAEAALNWLLQHMDDPDIDAPPAPVQSTSGGRTAPPPAPEHVASLCEMGFSEAQACKALRETVWMPRRRRCAALRPSERPTRRARAQGNSMERAVDWLFSHPSDAGDVAMPPAPDASVPPAAPPGPSVYELVGMVTHKGTSTHAGHYVAHVRVGHAWAFFNDEKVAAIAAADVPRTRGYLYFFRRTADASGARSEPDDPPQP